MASYKIVGAKSLNGKVKIGGNKNSVLPIMASTLLTNNDCILEGVPNIVDVEVMAKLLETAGAYVEGIGTGTLKINTSNAHSAEFPEELTQKLRASVLLIGPMLTRFGEVKMGYPGGDVIGKRPLNAHVQALEDLGATFTKENGYLVAKADNLKAKEIFLQEASVTATENAIIVAANTQGTTTIKRAASEPHVVDLCEFLIKMGAKIEGVGSNVLEIEGKKGFKGATHSIRPDHIEVGTFAILAAVTGGKIEISPIVREDLDMTVATLKEFGVEITIEGSTLTARRGELKAVEKITTDVWPGFPTDLMAPMIVLATQAEGVTILHDWMYESRMFFVDKLLSMGAKVEIADPHRVFVYGPKKLSGQKLDTPDIRAGIALVIAALIAQGESTIDRIELIERGYENVVERLTALGAEIRREE